MAKSKKSSQRSINISKGIIFAFFTIYLIFYGIGLNYFLEDAKQNDPGLIPYYVNYVPLLCFVGAAFLGMQFIIFIRNTRREKARQQKSRKKVRSGSIYKQALFLIIFIFSFIPLLSPIIDRGENDQNLSVYNDSWNGASEFKAVLEDEGYEVMNVQSSLSATERLNKSICLVLLGPNSFYNPMNEIPYFIDFFDSKNALLLCHDHGSTDVLFYEIFAANMLDPNVATKVPLALFPEGVVRDNLSYAKNPRFPILDREEYGNKSFPALDHPVLNKPNKIDKLILSNATSIIDPIEYFLEESGLTDLLDESDINFDDVIPWTKIGTASKYSFVDKKPFDGEYDDEEDIIDISIIGNLLGVSIPEEYQKIELDKYQPIFRAKETDNVRVFVSGDGSVFNNELIAEGGYDNKEFGINIIRWLTRGDDKDDWVVVFDEAHIRPEYSRDLTSAGIFGFIIQYVVHLSTNPLTAWIYPLLAVYTLRKYLPKKDQEEEKKKAEEAEKQEAKERFRTSSFFAEKIQWYHDKGHYEGALKLLYRRVERKLNAQLAGTKISTQAVLDLVRAKEGKITRLKEKRISKFLDRMIAIKEGKGRRRDRKVRSAKDFEELFFEMGWFTQNV